MVRPKSPAEIEILSQGGAILASILDELSRETQVGADGVQLDRRARDLIEKYSAQPSFLGYAPPGQPGFPAALCVSVNQAVVHGLPTREPFKEGDIVGLDLGIRYKGMFLDSARTVPVGTISPKARRLLTATKSALAAGIGAAQVANTVGDIGAAVQRCVEDQGFSVVRQLVGHGVGYAVHEDPKVPNYGVKGRGLKLKAGLVLAIEPMVTVGDPAVTTAQDGWTVITADGGLAAHEEHTVAILPEGPRILTLART